MREEPSEGVVKVGDVELHYTVVRSKRRKRSVAFCFEDNSLRILVPVATSRQAVEAILAKRADWILREFSKRKAESLPSLVYADGGEFPFLGHRCVLSVARGRGGCALSPGKIRVRVGDVTLSPAGLQEEVRLELMLWLRKCAKVKLKKRADYWAGKLGVNYKRLLVVKAVRRWGSCSADNIIRLNWRLMMLPLPLLDYVVLHELCHVRHKNHSRSFWNFLEKYMPDWKLRRQALRVWEKRVIC
ncbi:MAG: SprT family zinc-dependent metalloprotease [Alphaproteobacteria bacterium]|nr:SprT family zinc-dependent metalloprotease [Alphaproteobacteria bacterium]